MRRPDREPVTEPPRSDREPPPSGRPDDPSTPPKRERSAAATQERILDAAEQDFAAHGFAGARLREIATAAGVQPALIHHYFADKKGLYEAVIRRAVEQMSTASWRVLSTETDLDGIVRGFVDVMIDFSTAHQKLLSILRSELNAGTGELLDVVREKTLPILEAIVALTRRLQQAGELREDVDPREMVRAGLALVLSPILDAPVLAALLPEPADLAAVPRRKSVTAELLLGGIRARRT